MGDELLATLKSKREGITSLLRPSLETLHHLFNGDHLEDCLYMDTLPEPIKSAKDTAFFYLAGRDDLTVTEEGIVTVEEWIRVVHRYTVWNLAVLHSEEAEFGGKPATYVFEDTGIPFCGVDADAFFSSYLPEINRAIADFEIARGEIKFEDVIFTNLGFSAFKRIKHHNAQIRVILDGDHYHIRFTMGEAGYGTSRVEYCSELFKPTEFTHRSVYHNVHSATARTDGSTLHHDITFLLCVAENLTDVDIGSGPCRPEDFYRKFRMIYDGKTQPEEPGRPFKVGHLENGERVCHIGYTLFSF
ncbi:hypothetical protein GOV09_05370 [Candidatus Woesearchaeota archaeon]|nr:hypothetical protein [Candidatus Woesearchaeota archaeon]